MINNFFPLNHAVCEIMWKNMVEPVADSTMICGKDSICVWGN